MRAVIQRVTHATCRVDHKTTGAIESGLLVFLGFERDDSDEEQSWLIKKILQLRVFEDDSGRMNHSISETGGGILLISQFTLLGSIQKGTRPSFNRAEDPAIAEARYHSTLDRLRAQHAGQVASGKFAADMQIEAHNDGPVTLVIDSRRRDF